MLHDAMKFLEELNYEISNKLTVIIGEMELKELSLVLSELIDSLPSFWSLSQLIARKWIARTQCQGGLCKSKRAMLWWNSRK